MKKVFSTQIGALFVICIVLFTYQLVSAGQIEDAKTVYASKDYEKAFSIYFNLAENGNAEAIGQVGYMLDTGQGVKVNHHDAVKYYRKAAIMGDGPSQHNLCIWNNNKSDIHLEYAEKIKWCERSAEQGDPDAQKKLADIYYNGEQGRRNLTKAAKWLKLSGEQGNADSQSKLGDMYCSGKGVKYDFDECFKWRKKFAEQGDSGSQVTIAEFYSNDSWSGKDLVESYSWYYIAYLSGSDMARNKLDEYRQILTREQIYDAKKKADIIADKIAADKASKGQPYYNLIKAKEDGYSDKEIVNILGEKLGYDVDGIRKEGYTNKSIIQAFGSHAANFIKDKPSVASAAPVQATTIPTVESQNKSLDSTPEGSANIKPASKSTVIMVFAVFFLVVAVTVAYQMNKINKTNTVAEAHKYNHITDIEKNDGIGTDLHPAANQQNKTTKVVLNILLSAILFIVFGLYKVLDRQIGLSLVWAFIVGAICLGGLINIWYRK